VDVNIRFMPLRPDMGNSIGIAMFSQTVEYALRAVVHLAMQEGRALKTSDIAERTKVPHAYLSKVLQGLRAQGIVQLQRGIGGGVRLAQDPKTMTILDVVNAVDPIQRIDRCPLDLKTHGTHLCALHRRMDNAIMAMEEAFRSTTLAELLDDPNTSIPLFESKHSID